MRPAISLLVLLAVLLCPTMGQARGWRNRVQANSASRPTPAQNPYAARQVYPKYYHGFHARDLQNVGVPSGDVGLRGNGITWNPW
jgi:hypothetical protein